MKTFPLKIDDDLHKMIKHAAIEENESVHSWILAAINDKLEHKAFSIKEKRVGYGDSAKSVRSNPAQE